MVPWQHIVPPVCGVQAQPKSARTGRQPWFTGGRRSLPGIGKMSGKPDRTDYKRTLRMVLFIVNRQKKRGAFSGCASLDLSTFSFVPVCDKIHVDAQAQRAERDLLRVLSEPPISSCNTIRRIYDPKAVRQHKVEQIRLRRHPAVGGRYGFCLCSTHHRCPAPKGRRRHIRIRGSAGQAAPRHHVSA